MKLGFPLFPKTASTMASEIDAIYFFGLAISAIFSVLIAGLIFYLALRCTGGRLRTPSESGRSPRCGSRSCGR